MTETKTKIREVFVEISVEQVTDEVGGISFWLKKGQCFPLLASLAQNVLAATASEASTECVFCHCSYWVEPHDMDRYVFA